MIESEKMYTSGEVARIVGVSITTIKNWEEKGALKPDRKLPSGRRLYSERTVEEFIKSLNTDY